MNTTCQYPGCGIPIKPTPQGKYCPEHRKIVRGEQNREIKRNSYRKKVGKEIPPCKYNSGVECDNHICERCGFNPTEDERRRKLRRK